MRAALALFCSLPLVVACDAQSATNPLTTRAGLESGAGVDCEADYDACVSGGADAFACKQRYSECMGYPTGSTGDAGDAGTGGDDHWQACKDGFHDCVAAGVDVDTCLEKIRWCAGVCEAATPVGDTCEASLNLCVSTGGDPVECKDRYGLCVGATADPGGDAGDDPGADPGDGGEADPCMSIYDKCMLEVGDPVACKERYVGCAGR